MFIDSLLRHDPTYVYDIKSELEGFAARYSRIKESAVLFKTLKGLS